MCHINLKVVFQSEKQLFTMKIDFIQNVFKYSSLKTMKYKRNKPYVKV